MWLRWRWEWRQREVEEEVEVKAEMIKRDINKRQAAVLRGRR